ncbi:PLA2G15 family protein [Megaselia abdita]
MNILVIVGVLVVLSLSAVEGNWLFSSRKKTRSPVIFVPGNGGSQIETKFNKPNTVHYFCAKTQNDWYNVWLNIEELIPGVIDCWIDNVKLYYDKATRTTHNSPGVELRIPGWGDPFVVEWIDPTKNSAGSYFKDIAKALYDMGYERNKSLRGAPYDFRKAPNENEYWFKDMKKLVEDTYDQNNDTPVTIITHSMGSPMTLHLLQNVSADWKKKYIQRFISLAGAWAGSMKAVKVYAMGDDLDAFLLSGKTMRAEQISMPSLAFLLPNPLFWKPNEVIITTPGRNYTFAQLKEFFTNYYSIAILNSKVNHPTSGQRQDRKI